TDPGYLSDFVPDIGVLNGPYLVATPQEYEKLLASDWYHGIEQKLSQAGFKLIMANGFFGQRHLIADKPVRRPEDMTGMTVRVPPNTMWIETFKAIGARPTTVQWSEVYNALQQNVVQAAEAPLGSLWGSKLQETRKVISLTGHFTSFVMWPINASYFNRLPKDLQQILLEEGTKAGDYMTRLTLEQKQTYIDRFKQAGVTVVEDVDRPAFQKATASVYKAFPKWTPGLHETVMAILSKWPQASDLSAGAALLGVGGPCSLPGAFMLQSPPAANIAERFLRHGEEIIAGVALVIVVAAVCWGVLTRYVTEQPAAWAGEIAQIGFAWVVFLGAAAGFKYGMHISIDMAVVHLPAPLRRGAQALADVLIMLFLVYLTWLAIRFNIEAWNDPTSVLRLPRTVVYGSVLVGAACMAIRYGQLIRHRRAGLPEPMFRLPGLVNQDE
ncbi:MAG: TRAP transporter substrate-binding protein DctP, partial [Gammaproteobacteria bacterium]